MAAAIATGEVLSAHDISDGGAAVAAAEMCIASGLGLKLETDAGFEEAPGRYLVEAANRQTIESLEEAVDLISFGTVQEQPVFRQADTEISVAELTSAWRGTLDW